MKNIRLYRDKLAIESKVVLAIESKVVLAIESKVVFAIESKVVLAIESKVVLAIANKKRVQHAVEFLMIGPISSHTVIL